MYIQRGGEVYKQEGGGGGCMAKVGADPPAPTSDVFRFFSGCPDPPSNNMRTRTIPEGMPPALAFVTFAPPPLIPVLATPLPTPSGWLTTDVRLKGVTADKTI